ncbi:hypothetical protein [Campylobacter sp. 19-13652]|uniref:hypothetical protein n=1 Tax=Campylobacter sp. 19-13652 TaxID=2840180 RepID=UPI001C76E2B9|nr:hypothetical protein [Campylobacter sp. 19-13652]BCX79890.1 hypothetical protein LBC_13520 [Campylobacter sp. 19-13652]
MELDVGEHIACDVSHTKAVDLLGLRPARAPVGFWVQSFSAQVSSGEYFAQTGYMQNIVRWI